MSFHPEERKAAVAWRTGAAGWLDCSPITPHIVLHKRQKALMKTSGGFRSKADTQKMSFFSPLSLLTLPLGRIIQKSHLVEMSSCGGGGASSVTECCNASRAGALATLPRPSRPDLAGADICRHTGVKKWTLYVSSSWKVLATAS